MIKIGFDFIRSLCFLAEHKNFDRRVQIRKRFGDFLIFPKSLTKKKKVKQLTILQYCALVKTRFRRSRKNTWNFSSFGPVP